MSEAVATEPGGGSRAAAELIADEVAAVAGQLNVAHARLVALTARVIAQELWAGSGVRSVRHWLVLHAGLSPARAGEVVALARRAAELPSVTQGLEAGQLSVDQAVVVARYAPTQVEESVAEFARSATVPQLRRALSQIQFATPTAESDEPGKPGQPGQSQTAGTDGIDEQAMGEPAEPTTGETSTGEASTADGYPVIDPWGEVAAGSPVLASAPASLSMHTVDGRFYLSFSAPADVGALVEQAVREAKDALFTAGVTHEGGDRGARAVHGRSGVSLADALVEVASRSLASTDGTSRASWYRVYVHLSVDGGWVGGQGGIPPRIAAKFACDGVVAPVWERDGRPVSVGREQRIVPERTRRLIVDRDRGCRFPGCTAARFLEIHHIQHWAHGGGTDYGTNIALCPFHHDAHHRGEFSITGDPCHDPTHNDDDSAGPLTFWTTTGLRIAPAPTPPSGSAATGLETGPGRGADSSPYPRYAGPTGEPLHPDHVIFHPPAAPEGPYLQVVPDQDDEPES